MGPSICRLACARKTVAFGSTVSARMGCPLSPEMASKTCARSSPMSVLPASDRPPAAEIAHPAALTECLRLWPRLWADAPAGGQHGAEALRPGRVAHREARHQAAPSLASAASRHGRRHRPDRRLGADRQGCRRRLPDRAPARPDRGAVASVTGDGAYDRDDVYSEVITRHPDAEVIVPPRANAVPSQAAESAPTQRDRHLQALPSTAAWLGRKPRAITGALWSRPISRAGNGSSVTAYVPDRRATGNRGGHRGRRAEPNAGAGTPGVRAHRMTRNTGRAQCAHTADPCNKVVPRAMASRRWPVRPGSWLSTTGASIVPLRAARKGGKPGALRAHPARQWPPASGERRSRSVSGGGRPADRALTRSCRSLRNVPRVFLCLNSPLTKSVSAVGSTTCSMPSSFVIPYEVFFRGARTSSTGC